MKYLCFSLVLLVSSCSTIDTGNSVFDAVYSGTSAVIASDGASSKCEQGHAQDRVNCRKKKKAQVEALNQSIKKNSSK